MKPSDHKWLPLTRQESGLSFHYWARWKGPISSTVLQLFAEPSRLPALARQCVAQAHFYSRPPQNNARAEYQRQANGNDRMRHHEHSSSTISSSIAHCIITSAPKQYIAHGPTIAFPLLHHKTSQVTIDSVVFDEVSYQKREIRKSIPQATRRISDGRASTPDRCKLWHETRMGEKIWNWKHKEKNG